MKGGWIQSPFFIATDSRSVAKPLLGLEMDFRSIISIISPGGYLRGMTRAFQQGQLNLMGSPIGLSERKRQDQAL